MDTFDTYANSLFENTKFMYAQSELTINENAKQAYLQSSLLLLYSALDAYVYSICEELYSQGRISVFEKSFLIEKDVKFNNGTFILTKTLKMSRIVERIEYLFVFFSKKQMDKSQTWWMQLVKGSDLRNSIVHPKDVKKLDPDDVCKAIESVNTCINELFITVYKRPFPLYVHKLENKMKYD